MSFCVCLHLFFFFFFFFFNDTATTEIYTLSLHDALPIPRFRQGYAAEFGAPTRDDALYSAVSEGRRAIGLEHWLPLLYDRLDTLFDYVGDASFVLDARADEAASQRIAQVSDSYAARRAVYAQDPARADYKPLPPSRLYLTEDEWKERLAGAPLARLTPFEASPGAANVVNCGGRVG